MCFDFLCKFFWNISHSKKNSVRHYHKIYTGFHIKCPFFLLIFNIGLTGISRRIFKTHSNIKFHENPSSGSRVVPYGRTDRQDDTTGRFFAILRKRPLRTQRIRRSKHSPRRWYETCHLMVYGVKGCFLWDPYAAHKHNVSTTNKFLNVKPGGR